MRVEKFFLGWAGGFGGTWMFGGKGVTLGGGGEGDWAKGCQCWNIVSLKEKLPESKEHKCPRKKY